MVHILTLIQNPPRCQRSSDKATVVFVCPVGKLTFHNSFLAISVCVRIYNHHYGTEHSSPAPANSLLPRKMTATACTWRMDIFHTQGYSKSSHHIKRTDTALVREAFKTSRCPLISSPIYPRYLRASCSFQVPVWVHSNVNTANSQIHKSPKTASILIQTPCLSDESRSEQQGFSVLPTLETSMLSITETF